MSLPVPFWCAINTRNRRKRTDNTFIWALISTTLLKVLGDRTVASEVDVVIADDTSLVSNVVENILSKSQMS